MTSTIRLARTADCASIAAIYAPVVANTATSFEATPPDATEIARRIESLRPRYPWLVYDDGASILGYAYASGHRDRAAYQWSVEVSAYVHPKAHRRGIGKALYSSLFSVLKLQGYRNAYAGITLPNPASEALHKAVGFEPVGVYRSIGYKLGKWHDVIWLVRRLNDLVLEPPLPQTLDRVEDAPEFAAALGQGGR
jgi:phosphinothricin acetyltransferase